MESDWLIKEDEFYKENEKLELKTKQLLQKVNDVMKIQDNLISDSLRTQAEIGQLGKINYKKYDFALVKPDEKQCESAELNSEVDLPGNGVLKVYKAKLKCVIAEKERIQSELRQKYEETKKLQKENQNIKEEKEKWFLLFNTSKNNIGKLESQLTNANSKIQSRDAENAALRKEVEHLKKELKNSNLSANNCEVRLARACEESEKLRATLKQTKEEEKNVKEESRKQLNELSATIKRIQKQKIELLNGFKKQAQLIDVLKKQKVHIEALKINEMSRNEYFKILDWKFE